jgi:hypothetical protein
MMELTGNPQPVVLNDGSSPTSALHENNGPNEEARVLIESRREYSHSSFSVGETGVQDSPRLLRKDRFIRWVIAPWGSLRQNFILISIISKVQR